MPNFPSQHKILFETKNTHTNTYAHTYTHITHLYIHYTLIHTKRSAEVNNKTTWMDLEWNGKVTCTEMETLNC